MEPTNQMAGISQYSTWGETAEKSEPLQGCLLTPTHVENWNFDSINDVLPSQQDMTKMPTVSDTCQFEKISVDINKQSSRRYGLATSTPAVAASNNLVIPQSERFSTPKMLHDKIHTSEPEIDIEGRENPEKELAAIKEQCAYIQNTVRNFNVHVSSMPSNAQSIVQSLNEGLQLICSTYRDTINQDHGSSDTDTDVDSSESASGSRHRRVRFRGPRPAAYQLDNKNYLHKNSKTFSLASSEILPGQSNVAERYRQPNVSVPLVQPIVNAPINTRSIPRVSHTRTDVNPDHCSSRQPQPAYPRVVDTVSVEDLLGVLQRLDSRSVPKPDTFDLSSGLPISEFIHTFEEYCRGTFRGSSSLWVGELGRMLTGDVRIALDAMKAPGDSYEMLKGKLIRWVDSRQELLQSEVKLKFKTAEMKPQESNSLYAARLENYFHAAYPRRLAENNKTLRMKYFDSVPETFKKQLQLTQSISKSLSGKDMTWSQVVAYASQHEVEAKSRPVKLENNEVWVSQPTKESARQEIRQHVPVFSHSDDQNTNIPEEARQKPHIDPYRFSERPFRKENNTAAGRADFRSRKVSCRYCNKLGHIEKDCWRRLNLCLVCGSSDHRIATCPNRRYPDAHRDDEPPWVPQGQASHMGHQPSNNSELIGGNKRKPANDYVGNRLLN